MKVTVDVMDLQRGNDGRDTQDAHSAEEYQRALNDIITPAVRDAVNGGANLSNVTFSVGNEPAGPGNPAAFADWFAARASDLKAAVRAGGVPSPKVAAELIAYSVGDPPNTRAMDKIISSVNEVAVHFYPGGPADPSNPEYQALLLWKQRSGTKPFEVGELSTMPGVADRDNVLMGWLAQMERDGIRGVRFWQFGKNETAGHTDDRSLQNDDALRTLLQQQGFLP
jgi:hypothetical protein